MLVSKVTRLNFHRSIHKFQNNASHVGRVLPRSSQTRNRRAFGLLPHLALPLYRLALEQGLDPLGLPMDILRTERERQRFLRSSRQVLSEQVTKWATILQMQRELGREISSLRNILFYLSQSGLTIFAFGSLSPLKSQSRIVVNHEDSATPFVLSICFHLVGKLPVLTPPIYGLAKQQTFTRPMKFRCYSNRRFHPPRIIPIGVRPCVSLSGQAVSERRNRDDPQRHQCAGRAPTTHLSELRTSEPAVYGQCKREANRNPVPAGNDFDVPFTHSRCPQCVSGRALGLRMGPTR